MENKFFKNNINYVEKHIAQTQPSRDFFYASRKSLIKNYVLDPDVKIVKLYNSFR